MVWDIVLCWDKGGQVKLPGEVDNKLGEKSRNKIPVRGNDM